MAASPHAAAAAAAAAAIASDFADAPSAEPVASPFRPMRAQDPRRPPVVVPNDAMAVGEAAFDQAFSNAIANPGLLRQKPSNRMSESEYARYRAQVFGGESAEAVEAAKPSVADRLQGVSDEKLAAMEARIQAERDRRTVAEYAAEIAAGEAELDDLSDLTAADDQPFGDAFSEAPDFGYLEGDDVA